MPKNKHFKKKNSHKRSNEKLKAYKNIQNLLKDIVIGACQIDEQAMITYDAKKERFDSSLPMSKAFYSVKFNWKFMIAVFSRLNETTHHVHYKMLYTNRHEYLNELDESIKCELKDLFENGAVTPSRLTTFWLASPNQDMKDECFHKVAMELLHKSRVADRMISQFEIDTIGIDNFTSSFCQDKAWLENIEWEETVLE